MTPRSCIRPLRAPLRPAGEIADLLYRGLEAALEDQCVRRYEVPLSVCRVEPLDIESLSMRVQLERRGLIRMMSNFRVTHVGGTTYDVRCQIEGGPSCQYTYSLPGDSARRSTPVPRLATTLSRFLLDELERRVGRQRLQQSVLLVPARRAGPQ